MIITKKIIFLSVSLILALTAGWLNSLFSISPSTSMGLYLSIPMKFDFYVLVHFVISCIVPTILVNWLFAWAIVEHGNSNLQIRIFKEDECKKSIPVDSLVRAAYSIFPIVLLAMFFTRGIPTFWGLDFYLDDGIMQVTSRRYFEINGIISLSFITSGAILVLYAIFQPQLKTNKEVR